MSLATLVERLKRHEGARRNARGRHVLYKDSLGIWTLGYGRNVQDRGISEAEAIDWLTGDARDAMLDAASLFPSWLALDDIRRDVLADMAYNLGRERLAGFHDLIAAVEARDWPAAKAAMIDSHWHEQVGTRALELENEMLTGKAS